MSLVAKLVFFGASSQLFLLSSCRWINSLFTLRSSLPLAFSKVCGPLMNKMSSRRKRKICKFYSDTAENLLFKGWSSVIFASIQCASGSKQNIVSNFLYLFIIRVPVPFLLRILITRISIFTIDYFYLFEVFFQPLDGFN